MQNDNMPTFPNQLVNHANWRNTQRPSAVIPPAAPVPPTPPAPAPAQPTQPITTSSMPNIAVAAAPSVENHSPVVQPVVTPEPEPAPIIDEPITVAPEKPMSTRNIFVVLTIVFGVLTAITSTVLIYLFVNNNGNKSASTTTASVSTEEVKEGIIKSLGFFPNKLINPSDDVNYRIGVHRFDYSGRYVFGSYIGGNKSAAEVYVYWQYIKDYYGVDTDRDTRENITISFDQSVSEVYIGESGTSVKGDVLLFLLEDGTVEYMPVVEALKNHDFRSFGQLGGVEDIVKFYRADAITNERSYYTTLVQRADGSIIDLQTLLRAAVAGESPTLGEVTEE